MKKPQYLLTLLLGAAILQAPVRASAQTEAGVAQQVEALYVEGVALFRAGKYRQALDKFNEAYALFPEPNLLFNAGKAHEALGELDAAIAKYEACAAADGVDADVRAKTLARLEVLEAARMKSRLAPSEKATASNTVTTGAPVAPSSSVGLTVAKWSAAVVAAGLAGGGTVLFLSGASDHQSVEDAKSVARSGGRAPLTQAEAQGLVDDGEQSKTIGVGLLAGAGAAAILAAVLFVVDGDDTTPEVAVMPTAGGLGVGGTF